MIPATTGPARRGSATAVLLWITSGLPIAGTDCSQEAEYYRCVAYWCTRGIEVTGDMTKECARFAAAETGWCESGRIKIIVDGTGCRMVSTLHSSPSGAKPAQSPAECLPRSFGRTVRIVRIAAELDADLGLLVGIVKALRSKNIDSVTINGYAPDVWIAYVNRTRDTVVATRSRPRDPYPLRGYPRGYNRTLIHQINP